MQLDPHLSPRSANHRPLTPIDFLDRTIGTFPGRKAVVWREESWTYAEFGRIVARFARFLMERGIGRGDVVSVMCPNRPEMLAAHYAVPMVGAVLNSINTRLDQASIAYILDHSGSKLMIADGSCLAIAETAAATAGVPLLLLSDDGRERGENRLAVLEDTPVEPVDHRHAVIDEWQPICLNYTSGTTGNPKGVVYHHRGAYLNALGNVLALGLHQRSVYLWILPMFHCNGWCHTWAVTAAGALHVCLDRVDPVLIFEAIGKRNVTHMSCAPVVLYMLLNHEARKTRDAGRRVLVATGGASPTSALIAQLDALGFDLVHLYGLTESYGPETMCALDELQAELDATAKAELLARQGTRHITANSLRVIDEAGEDIPADGVAVGEIVLQGNTLMAGYYRDPEATETAFRNGLFHTGDLAVRHPDGQIEIRDRSKDVIISGGENISSLEIESALHQHPAVLIAAVVALTDPKWGEIPCAFIELKSGHQPTVEELQQFCKERLAGFKVPRRFLFRELPKTATGKIQKFVLRDIARLEAGEAGGHRGGTAG
ncbi:acyl-CoA synthase [Metarhizobium album]|uniref:3-methylmercaptopropionyl-CoA ligase n=1 Tax=Metarhizobium album TaxID=2182425 RepID=A0A2U2DLY7_9HYPH|nr:AMP-binding protein [Rhizobium album]PWE54318.1 acyl-CoA synthase [Rhizobium album]